MKVNDQMIFDQRCTPVGASLQKKEILFWMKSINKK